MIIKIKRYATPGTAHWLQHNNHRWRQNTEPGCNRNIFKLHPLLRGNSYWGFCFLGRDFLQNVPEWIVGCRMPFIIWKKNPDISSTVSNPQCCDCRRYHDQTDMEVTILPERGTPCVLSIERGTFHINGCFTCGLWYGVLSCEFFHQRGRTGAATMRISISSIDRLSLMQYLKPGRTSFVLQGDWAGLILKIAVIVCIFISLMLARRLVKLDCLGASLQGFSAHFDGWKVKWGLRIVHNCMTSVKHWCDHDLALVFLANWYVLFYFPMHNTPTVLWFSQHCHWSYDLQWFPYVGTCVLQFTGSHSQHFRFLPKRHVCKWL